MKFIDMVYNRQLSWQRSCLDGYERCAWTLVVQASWVA